MTRTLRNLALALCLAAPTQGAASEDLCAIISNWTEGNKTFEARVAGFEALGFKRIKGNGKLWVQGQVAHIAMSDLERAAPEDPADLGQKHSPPAGDSPMTYRMTSPKAAKGATT